jgi:carboxymethylenebutenolidase
MINPMSVYTQNIDLKMADGVCDAVFSTPTKEGKYPGVLFLMDAFGLRPYLTEMAEHIASHGYLVLQPNILYRAKRSPMIDLPFPLTMEMMSQAREQIMPLARSFNPENGVKDAEIYLDYISKRPNFNGKIGLTGYCMGGSFAMRIAAAFPSRVQAVASFHAGSVATDAPNSPHLLLPKIKARVYVAHADNDQSLAGDQIEKFGKAMKDANVNGRAELYSGASHGFSMRDLPAYNAGALEKHWKNLFEVLKPLQN